MRNEELFSLIPRRRLVEVWWLDSHGRDGWTKYGDPVDPRAAACKTVGYVLDETDEFLTVASSIGDDQFCQEMSIPKGCVRKVRRLK